MRACFSAEIHGVTVRWDGRIFRAEAPRRSCGAFTGFWICFPRRQRFIRGMTVPLPSDMKRGIIPLFKISILFLDREFEHDIYELIRAFYPESEINVSYTREEQDAAGTDLRFRVEKQDQNCLIHYDSEERRGVISVEFIQGQSSDALLCCKDPHEIRKENKDKIKYALYQLLVKLTGRKLPWGNLTGIRPAKLAMGMIESGI